MSACANPLCSCDPCTCADCACGAARLGALERRVMELVWSDPDRELTGRDVAGSLPDHAYTTVATVLDRLVHKGLVRRRTVGRTIRFSAAGTPAAHAATLMREALAAATDPRAALGRFAATLTPAEAEALRAALARPAPGATPEAPAGHCG